MPSGFGLAGAQPQKPTRFAPIYTGRFFSGLNTNRSPLRDANTTRLTEKFYGSAGDALIAGSNTEVTNRLTLARRPGNSIFDGNSWTGVDRFSEFHLFNATSEEIKVMVDQTDGLYSLFNSTKSLVWTKSPGAGQTYMQSVGNTLFFGNGVDNKKWLQTLNTWVANQQWNTPTTPFLSTFIIDPNGSIQQLTDCRVQVGTVTISSNVLTVDTLDANLTQILDIGLEIVFPDSMVASFLDNQTVTVTSVSGTSFTAAFPHVDYATAAETSKFATVLQGGKPFSGGTQPAWSTVPLTPGMVDPSLAITFDGNVVWTNRGTTVENWGITAPTAAPAPVVNGANEAWEANTYYMIDGLIIDSNGGLQQVTTSGTSGIATPGWPPANAGVGSITTDGTVVWTKLQTAASLVWASHFAYNPNSSPSTYVIGKAVDGTDCLFRLSRGLGLTVSGDLTIKYWTSGLQSGGVFTGTNPAPGATATVTNSSLSLQFNPTLNAAPTTSPAVNAVIDKAGEIVNYTTPFAGATTEYAMSVSGTFSVPRAGQVAFVVGHDDGFFFGINNGAITVAGPNNGTSGNGGTTAVHGYPILGGNNVPGNNFETYVIDFPSAGDFDFEFCFAQGSGSAQTFHVLQGNSNIFKGPGFISAFSAPAWPAWSTANAPNRPSVYDAATNAAVNFCGVSSNCLLWTNLGPKSDMVWKATTKFHLPGGIIDSNGNTENPFRAGVSGTTQPVWKLGLNQLTLDNNFDNLTWINKGSVRVPAANTLSTYNGGWKYCIALVNTLDDTVSNASPLSPATGNFIGVDSINFAPGSGLDVNKIDPQVDYVAIFRTTDGESTPFLIPGEGNTFYTVSLADYLANGYKDTTQDTGLNNLISAAINGENTPPAPGAINLTYHLNRIFFSIGNTVYWTSGPDTPVGNGLNGVSPLNFDGAPSLIKRLVPVPIGVLTFTVSGVLIIPGQGTATNPIQGLQPYLPSIGILSYNALDLNGSLIGIYTTENQFIIFDPSSGVSDVGFPIGNLLRQNDGQPGTSWQANNVYVTWHSNGEDTGWYLSDGQFGWYRLMPTPAPETGITWSPFATIQGKCGAVQSIEVSPGQHRLLVGPFATGNILQRDLTVFQDNNVGYDSWAVIGSIVLAQPGQVAQVSFITTDSVHIGTPMELGVIFDEALPYFQGPFERLNVWESDPPELPRSRTILGQRFYCAEITDEAALCRHIQIRINWVKEPFQNELLAMTVYGSFLQES